MDLKISNLNKEKEFLEPVMEIKKINSTPSFDKLWNTEVLSE